MASRSKWSHERDWTEVEARQVLAACEASGLSMRAFAFREGLRPRRLYWWARRLASRETSARGKESPAVSFVPAVVRIDPPGLASRAAITIRVGTRATMEIVEPSLVSAAWVAEVMTELERIACS